MLDNKLLLNLLIVKMATETDELCQTFMEKIKDLEKKFNENKLPLTEFFYNITTEFIKKKDNDCNIYLSAMLESIKETDVREECEKACKQAQIDLYKTYLYNLIDYIQKNNKFIEPSERYDKYTKLTQCMQILNIITKYELKQLTCRMNIKIKSIRNNKDSQFIYAELSALVITCTDYYDSKKSDLLKMKKNAKNRKKKDRKRKKQQINK